MVIGRICLGGEDFIRHNGLHAVRPIKNGSFALLNTGDRFSTLTILDGGPGENRTPTSLRTLDFESSASTNSTTGPRRVGHLIDKAPRSQEEISRVVSRVVTNLSTLVDRKKASNKETA